MSDHWIIVIPADPEFVPSEAAQSRALGLFRQITPAASEVRQEVSARPRFIDCGANFDRVICPHCRQDIAVDWWQDLMDRESEAGFPLAEVALPCCGTRSNLNALEYDWPQGFARFGIEAMNPGVGQLSREQLNEFEKILGCQVRQILQHL